MTEDATATTPAPDEAPDPTSMVTIFHPDLPTAKDADRGNDTAEATLEAFETVWAPKGWRIVEGVNDDGTYKLAAYEPKQVPEGADVGTAGGTAGSSEPAAVNTPETGAGSASGAESDQPRGRAR